jgi:hypothetical protein
VPHQSQPAIGDISGWGTGVATALGNNLNASGGLVAPTPAAAGDIAYWNGSAWVKFAGNNSGTQFFTENASGVPAWATVSGTGTVTNVATGAGLTGGPITSTGTIALDPTQANNWSGAQTGQIYASGFVNKFRNGTFDVWQRGTSALAASTSGAYTADGWIVKQTGAAFTCSQQSGLTYLTHWFLQCVGGTSNTDTQFIQRIESYVAGPLVNQTVTVQFYMQQNSGSAVTPKISTCYASAQDNFTTCTADLAATSLSSCASGTTCQQAYTFPVSASAVNGYQVAIDCNTALTSAQHCEIDAADIRATPGVATGVNTNPPPPELRPIQTELAFNQRYYVTSYGNGVTPGTATIVGIVGGGASGSQILIPFPWMRVAPSSILYWDAAGNQSKESVTTNGGGPGGTLTNNLAVNAAPNSFSPNGFWVGLNGNSVSNSVGLLQFTASAEL